LTTFEVTEVGLLPERQERLLGFEIDVPRSGAREQVHALHVVGWVVGRESPAVSVDLIHQGELVRVTPVRGPREDVAAAVDVDPATGLDKAPVLRTLAGYRRAEGEVHYGVDAVVVSPGVVRAGDAAELERG